MSAYLLLVCLTCAGDVDTSKIPDSCEVTVKRAATWADALDLATQAGYVSAYILDEEDGAWLRRSGGPAWCELPD